MLPKRITSGIVLAIVALASAAGIAAAATFKSGTYKGTLAPPRNAITVKLKLTGKKVSGLTISDIPLFCQGGGPAIVVHFSKATISTTGRFTSTGKYVIAVGPLKGQVGFRETIKGKFAAKGKLAGTLKSVSTHAAACGGTTTFTASRQ